MAMTLQADYLWAAHLCPFSLTLFSFLCGAFFLSYYFSPFSVTPFSPCIAGPSCLIRVMPALVDLPEIFSNNLSNNSSDSELEPGSDDYSDELLYSDD
jgi:hypothetical protein